MERFKARLTSPGQNPLKATKLKKKDKKSDERKSPMSKDLESYREERGEAMKTSKREQDPPGLPACEL